MAKVIINNKSDLPDWQAVRMCHTVMKKGRISNEEKQYCYTSYFRVDGKLYIVKSGLNKKSDKFIIKKSE